MGSCLSSRSCSSDRDKPTAKLILQDGRLEEFRYPVRVSYVLQSFDNDKTYFICNSDDMVFDGVVSSLAADEELHPGKLYFALPLCRLDRPLRAQEMAALAVRASSALKKCSGWRGSRRRVVFPLDSLGDEEQKCREDLVGRSGGGVGEGDKDEIVGRRRRRRGEGRFTAELSTIPE
ncbi:hypothetical protein SAY87_005754 [Trapa incisa]|uniref:Uncharacterized protein n=1 Tax=Trapa incisa TaxID=236973 RepID=A0AAN7Q712_9MYRT|nr:hypothetical protein SAY87_005754 [Trapa incisa]